MRLMRRRKLEGDLAAVEAKLATNDAELQETHKKVSRDRHEEQLLQQHVADLNTRAEQMKASHIEALQAVRMRDPATWSELRLILIIRR